MTCREFTDFILDHLEGRLPARVASEFDDHLAVCPDCRTYLRNYRETIRLTRAVARADDPLPDDVPAELIEAVLSTRRKGS